LHFIEVLIRLKPKTFLSRGYFDATLTVLTNMCVEEVCTTTFKTKSARVTS